MFPDRRFVSPANLEYECTLLNAREGESPKGEESHYRLPFFFSSRSAEEDPNSPPYLHGEPVPLILPNPGLEMRL